MFLSLRVSFCRCDVKYTVWTPERDTDTRGRDQMLENSHWYPTSADKPQRFHLVKSKVPILKSEALISSTNCSYFRCWNSVGYGSNGKLSHKDSSLKFQKYLQNLFFYARDTEVVTAELKVRSSGFMMLNWSKQGRSSVKFRDTDLLTVRSSVQISELTEGVNGKHTNSPFIYSPPNLHLLKSSWSVESIRQVVQWMSAEINTRSKQRFVTYVLFCGIGRQVKPQ